MKEELINRLMNLKSSIEKNSNEPVSLTPSLRHVQSTVIYDRNMKVIGEFSQGRRNLITLEMIPPLLIKTVLLIEDKRFYQHHGIDLKKMVEAMIANLRNFSFSGRRSTITSQLSKILLSENKKTIRRKIQELFCTHEIEKRFTKEEILSFYLNSIYLGHNNFGIKNASWFYFKKPVSDLNIFDISVLVGIIPNPVRYSPLIHPSRCRKRQMLVLNTLVQEGMADPIYLKDEIESYWEEFEMIKHAPTLSFWSVEDKMAPYFIEYVRQYLTDEFGDDFVRNGEFRVYSTLDLEKQLIAEQVLREALEMQNRRNREAWLGNPEDAPGLEVEGDIEGAIVAIHPKSGEIVVMVGGSGYTFENQFNRAVSSRRQVGSSFKPFVFAAAFEEKGYTKESKFFDRPLEIRASQGVWRPQNYENIYYGMVTLEIAMKKSLNSVAVQLVQEIGPEPVIRIISTALDLEEEEAQKRFQPFPSLALGVYGFSPLEFVRAYSIFPNGGEKVFPHAIIRVEDKEGRIILDLEGELRKRRTEYDLENRLRVISYETAEKVNELLREVLKEGGTANEALVSSGLNIEAYGKTGTTNNYTDAWFIGYTYDIVVGVWVGFDDPSYSLGEGQAGGVVAAPIWAEFMKRSMIAK
ncbi:MAG: transglycosylase domain-containing protein [Spirochaetota bacterium]